MRRMELGKLIRMISLIILIPALLFFYIEWAKIDAGYSYNAQMIEIALIVAYFWAIYAWAKTGHRLVCIYFLFLLYTFLSNASQVVYNVLGITGIFDFDNIYLESNPNALYKALLFQIPCIVCLNIGALYGAKNGLRPLVKNNNYGKRVVAFTTIRPSDVVLLALFSFELLDIMLYLLLRSTMSYGDAYFERSTISNAYIHFAFHVMLLYNGLTTDYRKVKIIFAMIGVMTVLYYLIGSRTPVIALLAILMIISYRRMPEVYTKRNVIIAIPILLVFLAVTGAVTYMRSSALSVSEAFAIFQKGFGKLVGQLFYEMGQQTTAIAVTISKTDAGIQAHEQTMLYHILTAVFPTPVLSLLGIDAPRVGSLDVFATGNGINGKNGFSCLAEFYFDFGRIGYLFMGLFGFIFTRVEKIANRNLNYGRFLFSCVAYAVLAKQVFFARSSFALVSLYLRLAFYVFVIWVIMKKGKIRVYREQEHETGGHEDDWYPDIP